MKQLTRCILVFVILTIGTGLIYPYVATGISQLLFPRQANGSLIMIGNEVVGSKLIGQNFARPGYFGGRPSATEKPYNAGDSGGSNFGPTNKKYLGQVADRVRRVREANALAPDTAVPADLVLASGSGLDPHISVAAARLQAPRVAKSRNLSDAEVNRLIDEMTRWQYSGRPVVTVLEMNLALDRMAKK
jgi:K+-transporting ATPase ATPase C chain